MSAYVVALLQIHDPERYARYAAGFLLTLKPFGGRLLAADTELDVLEGARRGDKAVIIAFSDAAAAKAWAASPAYRAIAVDRLAASEALVVLADG